MRRLALLPLLLMAACAGQDRLADTPPGVKWLPNARVLVQQTDWSNPDTIEIKLVNHAFVPSEIILRRNQPTRLVLTNASGSDHTFVADEFFRTIAVKELSGAQGTEPGPYVEKVVVPAGQTKELLFVPTSYGAYHYICTVPGHNLLGMNGVVHVR